MAACSTPLFPTTIARGIASCCPAALSPDSFASRFWLVTVDTLCACKRTNACIHSLQLH